MYFTVLNGIPTVVTHQNKPILYPGNTSALRSTQGKTFDDNHVNQLVRDNGGFVNGWCQLEDYWVVNDEGMNSPFFKRLANIGQYYSLPTEAPAFLAELKVGGIVQSGY